jgi:hypothetical protein
MCWVIGKGNAYEGMKSDEVTKLPFLGNILHDDQPCTVYYEDNYFVSVGEPCSRNHMPFFFDVPLNDNTRITAVFG